MIHDFTNPVTNLARALDHEDRPNDAALLRRVVKQLHEMYDVLNTPLFDDFWEGLRCEVPHQRLRWGEEHDKRKAPGDWFWLLAHLATKAHEAHSRGDLRKAKHHTISSAAVLCHWHQAILKLDQQQRKSKP